MTRADRPRISSRTSGFFFCGMMLLPVQIASGSARKENSCVLQRTHSSAQPERCSAIIVRTKTDSRAKSRSLDTSRLLAATPSKPRARATCSRSIGRRRAGQRGRPQGQDVQPLPAIGQAVAVAGELLDVGQEVMRGQDRLGALHVRVAGQDQVAVPLGGGHQGALQADAAARRSGPGRRGSRA